MLGYEGQAALLQQTLDEEKETDLLLTDIAENQINIDAEQGDGEGNGAAPQKRGRAKARA
jgi:ferritin-like metal-binding protein YciE